MPDWLDPSFADVLSRAQSALAELNLLTQGALAVLVGALLAATGARIAIGAAFGMVLYGLFGPATGPSEPDNPIHLALTGLAALGLLQAILNLAFGRDTGGTVLWSIMVFAGVIALWRGPAILLRLLRIRGPHR